MAGVYLYKAQPSFPGVDMNLSKLAADAQPSATLSLNSKAKELAANGQDVAKFTVGEPDFDTPDNIKQAAIRAIQSGFTRYTPAAGTKELREAITGKFERDNGLKYEADQILVSNGAKHALYMIMMCLLGEGDEAVLPAPYWVSYSSQVEFCGARPVVADATGEPDLKLTPEILEENITEDTRLLVLNSPCNPSGVVYSRQELEELVQVAVEHDLWILSDEVYEKLIYDDLEHVAVAGLSEEARRRTITFNAVSKTYAMTGWRIGYAAGPKNVIQAAGRLQSNMTSGPNSIAQKAAVEAITGDQESVEEMRQTFADRRDIIVDGLNGIEGVQCVRPQGAFYALPDCSDLLGHTYAGHSVENSTDLSKALLEEVLLAVVPGAPFGAEGHLRFSYAASEETIEKGIERLQQFIDTRED
jgi:aspartate aminotransferase